MTSANQANDKYTLDVVIPTYRPGPGVRRLFGRLLAQTYPIGKINIKNTEEQFWRADFLPEIPAGCTTEFEIHHLAKSEFDHGRTRAEGAGYSQADIVLFMTHDAVPATDHLAERLVRAFDDGNVAAAYARQLPADDCNPIERITREFNYPAESRVKSAKDLGELGIKTYFCSNVCAAYRREVFERLGGFIRRTIFNEDMIFAAGAVKAGYSIAYVGDGAVIHSHNYTAVEYLRRNFDLGVSQADHPEVFSGVSSEGEGVKLVKATAAKLKEMGKAQLIPKLVWVSAFKYMGYRLGKSYKRLPERWIRRLTMNQAYWT